VAGCATGSENLQDGKWLGDVTGMDGRADRLEITVDSSGRAVHVEMARWELAGSRASATRLDDSIELVVARDRDTTRLRGIVERGQFQGAAHRGGETRLFTVRRLHPVSPAEWAALFGSYRTADSQLVTLSPFEEFGPTPQLVHYRTGRVGPLIPIGPDTFLVGHALIAPVLPGDTLDVRRDRGGAVAGIRVALAATPPIEAARLATRDEELEFSNGAVTLRGTLTLPAEASPHPAVVMVHGSGPLKREMLAPWARFFAGLGYAVLNYDKRGTGQSTGDWKEADFQTLAADVLAGIRAIAGRPDIRRDKIGLWGVSQGGWILPLAQNLAPSEIAFLIVHAGTGTTVREQGILNLQNEYRFAGAPDSVIEIVTRYRVLDDSVTTTGQGWERLRQFYETNREAGMLTEPAPADAWFRTYYRMLIDYDPAPTWAKVTCPVLLFFGERDANVPPAASWPPIADGLARAGNREVTSYVLPNANHLLLKSVTGSRDEYPRLSRFVPGYFDRMAAWLDRVGGR
jgi:alpha-beta hydrolase superfamily lysophospholipase